VTASAAVLDASVTAAWLLPDERTAGAERAYVQLRRSAWTAHAPELWLWECSNIIVNGVRRQRIAVADTPQAWGLLDLVRTRVELSVLETGQVRACLALAVEESLSMYDAAYLWLAMSLRLPLLSHDDRLRQAAQRQRVPVLRLEDLS
jgi:predicted nucleic acid-binding protein